MTEILFVVSVALAHAMTNLDNLVVMLMLAPAIGALRCASAYLIAQVVGIAVAAIAGSAALGLLGPWVGYVGFIPIGLGVFTLWQQARGETEGRATLPASLGAAIVMFLSLTLDTVVVMAALLGDSSEFWDGLAYLGAALSICVLVAVFVLMSRAQMPQGFVEKLGRFAPFVMILVGIYILSNSVSDVV